MNEAIKATSTEQKNIKLFGIIMIISGVLAIAAPLMIGVSIAIMVGLLIMIAGLGRIILAFQASSRGLDLKALSIGVLMLVCGIVLVTDPILASGLLTILLAVYFLLDGTIEILSAISLRPLSGWGWLLTGGIISFLLGLMIWMQFPLSGAWAIGVLLGIKLLFSGITLLSVGASLQKV